MFASINNTEVTGVYVSRMSAGKAKVILSTLVKVDAEMTEGQLTKVYNYLALDTRSRIRGKQKALGMIGHAFKKQQQADDVTQSVKAHTDTLPQSTDTKPKGIKAQVRALLTAPGEPNSMIPGHIMVSNYTVDELMAETGGTQVSVQTALSDLKSDKYAGSGGKLDIIKTNNQGDPADYHVPQGGPE